MKLRTVIRLVLAVTLFVVAAESCGRNDEPTRTDQVCKVRPPRYRHRPGHICHRGNVRPKRQSKSYEENRTDEQIRAEHNNMINAGYVFIGWHGTSYDVGRRLVRGESYSTTTRVGNDRLWMGVWTSSNVERSVGYMGGDPVLLRVYVRMPQGAQRNIFLDGTDINNAVTTPFFCSHDNPSSSQMMNGDGQYLICGPDGAFGGQELILSRDMIPDVRFLYSAHNRDIHAQYGCADHRPNRNAIESTSADWAMSNINAFLASIRRFNLFSNYRWHDEHAK